jgi:hypothetical protein
MIAMAVAAIAVIVGYTSARAQFSSGSFTKLDTSTITLMLDGREQRATAVAYVVAGRLFINGIWIQDSSAKYGVPSIASAYMLRVFNKIGEHQMNTRDGDVIFSTLYARSASGKAYAIYRIDEHGGSGSVTIASITEQSVRGNFTFTAYNSENPAETKTVMGRFDLPYQILRE